MLRARRQHVVPDTTGYARPESFESMDSKADFPSDDELTVPKPMFGCLVAVRSMLWSWSP